MPAPQRHFFQNVDNYIAPTVELGDWTQVWHFAVVQAGAKIGKHCSVGSGAEIGFNCRIGDRVRIGAHVFLPANSVIEDDVFIGPNTVFTDDRYPRAGNRNYTALPPIVRKGASIGAGVTVLPGICIGEDAMVGAGSTVAFDVRPNEVFYDRPERRTGVYSGPRAPGRSAA